MRKVLLAGRFRPCASGRLPVLDDADIDRAAGRAAWASVCGHAFAAQVPGNEVRVDDGHARHGGEGQLVASSRRQLIGTRTTAVSYPTCAQGG